MASRTKKHTKRTPEENRGARHTPPSRRNGSGNSMPGRPSGLGPGSPCPDAGGPCKTRPKGCTRTPGGGSGRRLRKSGAEGGKPKNPTPETAGTEAEGGKSDGGSGGQKPKNPTPKTAEAGAEGGKPRIAHAFTVPAPTLIPFPFQFLLPFLLSHSRPFLLLAPPSFSFFFPLPLPSLHLLRSSASPVLLSPPPPLPFSLFFLFSFSLFSPLFSCLPLATRQTLRRQTGPSLPQDCCTEDIREAWDGSIGAPCSTRRSRHIFIYIFEGPLLRTRAPQWPSARKSPNASALFRRGIHIITTGCHAFAMRATDHSRRADPCAAHRKKRALGSQRGRSNCERKAFGSQKEGVRIAKGRRSDREKRALGSRDTASEASQHPRSSRPAGGARPPGGSQSCPNNRTKKAIFRSILPPRRRRAQGAHCGPEAPYNPLNNS